ncbi:MAG: hypothetical protein JST84_26765 [Acidobacteria bacterium]|nr:hypothetical protein [Acidobacteriota bacterium]
MSETTNPEVNIFDEIAASFWAVMPEEMANTIAGVKKDLLTGLRSTIDSMVDHDLNCLERHLEKARQMREEWNRSAAAPESETAQS